MVEVVRLVPDHRDRRHGALLCAARTASPPRIGQAGNHQRAPEELNQLTRDVEN